jgi:hypothetical protein
MTTNPPNALCDHDIPERIEAVRQDRNEAYERFVGPCDVQTNCVSCDGDKVHVCRTCRGNGSPGYDIWVCWTCGGSGQEPCEACDGTGVVEVDEQTIGRAA